MGTSSIDRLEKEILAANSNANAFDRLELKVAAIVAYLKRQARRK